MASVTTFAQGGHHHIDAVRRRLRRVLQALLWAWRRRAAAAAAPSAMWPAGRRRRRCHLRRRRYRPGCRRRGGHFDGDLVGFQLAQHFIDGDGIAGFLEPGGDGGFGHGFAQRGHADFGRHGYYPLMVSASFTSAACWALCGWPDPWRARPSGAAGVIGPCVFGLDPGQHPFDIGFDEGPGALVLGLFLAPDHFGLLEPFQFLDHRNGRERIELFEPHQVDIVDAARVAFFQQIIVDLARAHDDAFDLVVGVQFGVGIAVLRIIPQHAVEAETRW